MQEPTGPAPVALRSDYGKVGRTLVVLARWFALIGGATFTALVLMQVVTIVTRKLFSWTVPGDLELLQMCAAFASAAFFAWCHMAGGDVKVDFFTDRMPPRRIALMDAFGSLLVGLFGLLIAWRTGAGAASVLEAGETSAIIGIPVWIPMAAMVPCFVLLGACGLYRAIYQLRAAMRHPA